MTTRLEGILAIVAALVVLFSAMWDPWISIIVSVTALAALGLYKFINRGQGGAL